MKILQVIHDFLPRHQAGSELYCYHISQALKNAGHDVRLFYSEIDHDQPSYSIRQGEFKGLPFWEVINNHGYRSFEETYQNPPIEKAFAACLDEFHPDVAHFHHLLGLSYGCIRLCKERHMPVVFTLHDYWLTCPRGGGQRFRGEGQVCHHVDTTLCASCIARYSFGIPKSIRLLKKALSAFERGADGDWLPLLQKARIRTPKRAYVSRGHCSIEGDARGVMFAHPPSTLAFRYRVPDHATLTFAVALDPTTYDKEGNGVRFLVHCNEDLLFAKVLHPKETPDDRGWHEVRIPLQNYGGKRCEFVFETQVHPHGKADFCTACWAEPRLLVESRQEYTPPPASTLQTRIETALTWFQKRPLKRKVDQRTRKTLDLFQQVDLFIAPSRFLRKKYIEYGLEADKIVFSDYGIATRGYPPHPRKAKHPIRFSFVGTLVVHKGLHVLIEAFNRLPADAAVLNVYGDPKEFTGYVSRIQSMIAHPNIHLRGRINNDAIPGILAQTDVLIVPSIWFENSPITIHEAFLAQVPVITSRFGGMADLVKEEENGLLFMMGDPQSLYRCLLKCVEDPAYIDSIRPQPESVKTLHADVQWLQEIYQEFLHP